MSIWCSLGPIADPVMGTLNEDNYPPGGSSVLIDVATTWHDHARLCVFEINGKDHTELLMSAREMRKLAHLLEQAATECEKYGPVEE